jgi:hypothetical protein
MFYKVRLEMSPKRQLHVRCLKNQPVFVSTAAMTIRDDDEQLFAPIKVSPLSPGRATSSAFVPAVVSSGSSLPLTSAVPSTSPRSAARSGGFDAAAGSSTMQLAGARANAAVPLSPRPSTMQPVLSPRSSTMHAALLASTTERNRKRLTMTGLAGQVITEDVERGPMLGAVRPMFMPAALLVFTHIAEDSVRLGDNRVWAVLFIWAFGAAVAWR